MIVLGFVGVEVYLPKKSVLFLILVLKCSDKLFFSLFGVGAEIGGRNGTYFFS